MTQPCDCNCPPGYTGPTTPCDQCAWLDGTTRGVGAVISALRVLGTATTTALADEMGCTRSNVEHRLRPLKRSGRVKRIRMLAELVDCGRVAYTYSLADPGCVR